MKQKALLVMAHQGRTFIEPMAAALKDLNVACLVVSSTPRSAEDLAFLEKHSEHVWVGETDNIRREDVDMALAKAAPDYEVLATLATNESYRIMMATVNQQLPGLDVSPAALSLTMDKHRCRNALLKSELSQAHCYEVNGQTLAQIKASGDDYFIKPNRGAGSFACFRLTDDLTMDRIEALQQQMKSDKLFAAIFNGEYGFTAERFISGEEFSFEAFVVDNQSYVVGTHAKYLEESMGTTLEMTTTLPAVNLTDEEQLGGEQYIAKVLNALGLDQGTYHIEARFDRANNHWDIIEVNTRMGGSFINDSVEIFTEGYSVMKLWINSLCCTDAQSKDNLVTLLSGLRESRRRANNSVKNGTVFLCRYGEPGRTLEGIHFDGIDPAPLIFNTPMANGSKLPYSERGIFILNVLWKVGVDTIASDLVTLPELLDEYLVVDYS